VPACNEVDTIRATAESILQQDYPDLELLLLNDRSLDGTGAVMAQVAAEHPDRVRYLEIRELPAGWLGKNHALWVGTQHATGEWLLFTDADMLFDPTCFRRAVSLAETEHLDHLCMLPQIVSTGALLGAYVAYFVHSFCTYKLGYLSNTPGRNNGIGCGGFNMLRRSAYVVIGTHMAISLRPDDDMRLGQRLKRLGLRQRSLSAAGMARVEWYPSFRAAIKGLEKNMFPTADYSLLKMLGMSVSLLALDVAPFLLPWVTSGWVRTLVLATILVKGATYLATNFKAGIRAGIDFLLYPFMAVALTYTLLRSTWLAYRQGGIYWRGTFYPLDMLRKQTGLEGT
jgi:glycosyltransferase involved in cell wall biosynthesis